jgi:hypothetical protein
VIFNIGSAHKCESRKRGLCQLPNSNECYAFKDENRYKQTLVYRNRQLKYWDAVSVHQFIKDIGHIVDKSKIPILYMRFNEAGDIRHTGDILKMNFIAKWIWREYGISTYTYTARKDMLPLLLNQEYITINGSGFMVHNKYMAASVIKNKRNICICNCNHCNKCKVTRGRTIEALIH